MDAIVREAPDDLEDVLALGPAMRTAQEDGDRERLRELVTERRTLLGEIVAAAADRAEATGQRVGDSAREEVEQTLLAAIAGAAAAAAVRSGRLVRALGADGIDEADLPDVVAGDPPAVPEESEPRRAPRHRADGEHRHREVDHRAEEGAAEHAKALEDARERAEQTESAAREADAEVAQLRARFDAAEQSAREAHAAAEDAAATARRLADGS